MNTNEMITEAYKSWLLKEENQTLENAFFAGAQFIIDYLIKHNKI